MYGIMESESKNIVYLWNYCPKIFNLVFLKEN